MKRLLIALAMGATASLWPVATSDASISTVTAVKAPEAVQRPFEQSTVALQYMLRVNGYSVRVDGWYGPQTTRLIKHWQQANGLEATGVADDATFESFGLNSAGEALVQAERVDPPAPPPVIETAAVGLGGQPFAPAGLSGCDEMNFYRAQWGLPDRFAALGWRESNCRNEVGVRTFCCYGYWQMYFSMHMADARAARVYALCGVDSPSDYNGDDPLDKQKMACVTSGVFKIVGYSAWGL